MLVKNLLGQITTIAGITFQPGETKTVDNSYIENLAFVTAISNNTLSILAYDKASELYTVNLQIAAPYTLPSIDQKCAMVAATSPGPTNAFLTEIDYIEKHIWCHRISDTEIYCRKLGSQAVILNTLSSSEYLVTGESTGQPLPVESTAYVCYNETTGQFRLSQALLDTQVALFLLDDASKFVTFDGTPRVSEKITAEAFQIAVLEKGIVELHITDLAVTTTINGIEYTTTDVPILHKEYYTTSGIKEISSTEEVTAIVRVV